MKERRKIKVAVAMSGGVDSSVAAFLLRQEFEVLGVHMRLFGRSGFFSEETSRSSESAEAAARRVAGQLGIKFYPFDLGLKFEKEVVDYFLESYAQGLTPNPCAVCNPKIKFGELLKRSREIGADFLATGHYALIKGDPVRLYAGKDRIKDQSYFLAGVKQNQLKRVIFPLGGYKKEQVRKIAEKEKLPCLKKESQDICFLPGDHNDFLRARLKMKKGKIKTLDEKNVGEHNGLPFYTVGQRRGVKIGGTGPYYVVRADYRNNILYVSKDGNDPALYRKEFVARKPNWISGKEPKLPIKCKVAIRYRHDPVACRIEKGKGGVIVKLDKPQRAVTPGQSAVFYASAEILGGGVIDA